MIYTFLDLFRRFAYVAALLPSFTYAEPMKIFITHQSACEYWASAFTERGRQTDWMKALPSGNILRHSLDMDLLARRGIHGLPIHVGVAAAGQRSQHASVRTHVMGGSFPKGSFVHLSGDYWVASPELAFCQMAAELSFAETVKLGYELTARYRLNEFLEDPDKREPLTSTRILQDFCARAKGIRGVQQARKAAAYVAEHAESPMEITVAMLLTLPRMHGGYGLPKAQLNPEIQVRSRTDRRASHDYRCDLVWPSQRVIAEYDSDLHHTGKADVLSDARRRNNLQDAGWHVVALTWDQVRFPSVMDAAAAQLGRALGQHASGYMPLHMAERRAELRRLLLPGRMQ